MQNELLLRIFALSQVYCRRPDPAPPIRGKLGKKSVYGISRGSNPCLNTFPYSLDIFGSRLQTGQV